MLGRLDERLPVVTCSPDEIRSLTGRGSVENVEASPNLRRPDPFRGTARSGHVETHIPF